MKLYDKVANALRENIYGGLFVAGDKLPSIRQLVAQHSVSISTVQQAYHQLEMEDLIEARPKSGLLCFFSNCYANFACYLSTRAAPY